MKRKALLLALSAALAAGCLAGCGKGSGKTDGDGGSEAGGTQADAETEASDAAGEADKFALASGDVSLKFWCDEDEMGLFQEMIDSFIAEHKSEANLEVTIEPIGASICKDTLLGDITNGADLFSLADDQLLTLVAAGAVEPIQNGEEIAAQHLDGAVEAASVNGTMYAYPVSADNGYFLYYDKKYFDASDVETLDGVLKVCEENGKKFVMDWSSGWYLYAFFGNTGLELSLNEDGLTNSCNWNATEGDIKGVDIAQAMLDISASPAFMNNTDFVTPAKDGTAIAVVSGVWDINNMKEAFGDDYGACKLPTYTVAGKQVQMSSFTGYRLLGVNAYSKYRGWAEKLAEYLTNEDNQKLRFERAERGPSNKNAAASDALNNVPAIVAVIDQSQYGVLQKVGQNYWTPMTEFGTAMAEGNPKGVALQDLLDQMVAGITQ